MKRMVRKRALQSGLNRLDSGLRYFPISGLNFAAGQNFDLNFKLLMEQNDFHGIFEEYYQSKVYCWVIVWLMYG
ncbi:MAG: hypothetical protein HY935_01885 [Nitrosomonadales bacterium]|nr:hypothetical protein [Nitrosomonadales bacterium]